MQIQNVGTQRLVSEFWARQRYKKVKRLGVE
jgi:hypothetical protein